MRPAAHNAGVPPIDLNDLTEAERLLWKAFPRGEQVHLGDGTPTADGFDPGTWGSGRQVRASVLSRLLCGAVEPEPGYTAKVRLTGARITGSLNLNGATIGYELELERCWFDEKVDLGDTKVRSVWCLGTTIPALDAWGIAVDGRVYLGRCRLGPVNLDGARIADQLALADSLVMALPSGGPALSLSQATVERSAFLTGVRLYGELTAIGAHVGGALSLQGAMLANPGGCVLAADGLTVTRDLNLDGLTAYGQVRLVGAQLGLVDLSGAALHNPDGYALYADRVNIRENLFGRRGFTVDGEIRLLGGHIGGQLDLSTAVLRHPREPALNGDGLVVDRDALCGRMQVFGETRLAGARVAGLLDLSGAVLANPGGCALNGENLQVAQDIFGHSGLRTQGDVRLVGARIGGILTLDGAQLANPGGNALSGDLLTVGTGLFCRAGFGADGHVSLRASAVNGKLTLDGAVNGHVDLRDTRVGTLELTAPRAGRLRLDGLEYADLEPYSRAGTWLPLLGADHDGYRAQPYEQIAAYYRRLGHDDEARRVMLAKRRAHRASMPWWRRPLGLLLDGLAGYGYAPGRAMAILVAAWAAGWVYFSASRDDAALQPRRGAAHLTVRPREPAAVRARLLGGDRAAGHRVAAVDRGSARGVQGVRPHLRCCRGAGIGHVLSTRA